VLIQWGRFTCSSSDIEHGDVVVMYIHVFVCTRVTTWARCAVAEQLVANLHYWLVRMVNSSSLRKCKTFCGVTKIANVCYVELIFDKSDGDIETNLKDSFVVPKCEIREKWGFQLSSDKSLLWSFSSQQLLEAVLLHRCLEDMSNIFLKFRHNYIFFTLILPLDWCKIANGLFPNSCACFRNGNTIFEVKM